jgi:hypothetical protein
VAWKETKGKGRKKTDRKKGRKKEVCRFNFIQDVVNRIVASIRCMKK